MRKLFVSVALATATLAVVPAAAHPGHGWSQHSQDRHAFGELLQRLDRVEHRIDRSARRGIVSPREAFSLRRYANRIEYRIHRAGRQGLSRRQFAELNLQVDRLERRLRIERRDFDGRRG